MNEIEFTRRMEYIIAKLKEKGYDPYDQLACYVLLGGNQYYITSHGDARSLIRTLDLNDVKKYLDDKGIKWNKYVRNETK